MIEKEKYKKMLEKYGTTSSWAIWELPGSTVKSNTESLRWVNNPDLLKIINTGYVFVGLNIAGTHGDQDGHFQKPWANFHSGYSYQNDYKLRCALQDTKYWGSYITDVIKNYPEVESGKVKQYLNRHPEVILSNIRNFEEELSYLGNKPVLVAMGGETNRILNKYLGDRYKVVVIKHYSYTISKENYRKEVLAVLDSVKNECLHEY